MSDDNGFVERPAGGARGSSSEWLDRIIATSTNGKAVRIPLNGEQIQKFQGRYRAVLKSHGLRFHMTDTKDGSLTVWAERMEPPK